MEWAISNSQNTMNFNSNMYISHNSKLVNRPRIHNPCALKKNTFFNLLKEKKKYHFLKIVGVEPKLTSCLTSSSTFSTFSSIAAALCMNYPTPKQNKTKQRTTSLFRTLIFTQYIMNFLSTSWIFHSNTTNSKNIYVPSIFRSSSKQFMHH